jgi:RNA polymerase sigma-70 factor (ECF subfamily)
MKSRIALNFGILQRRYTLSCNILGSFTAYSMTRKNIYQKFEIIYNQFAEGIFRYTYFKVSDYELARDITSETFIKYWKILAEEKKITSHKALLYLIAKGFIIDNYRKKKNKRISLESVDERFLGALDTVEDTILQKQALAQVYTKIKQLKKDFQDILFLHYVEDLTVKEIAFIQKKNENAIRVMLHRALKSLKEKL